jgi:TPR repeat protein
MYNLGCHYDKINDLDNAIKYYLMASDNGDSDAMFNLGCYYDELQDWTNATKYYLMAIEKGNTDAMHNIGIYYENIKKDYKTAYKYYELADKKSF